MAGGRRPVLRIDPWVVDRVCDEIGELSGFDLIDGWCWVALRGGPYDGLEFPAMTEHVGNPEFWIFLPVTSKRKGPAGYAWYQHRQGTQVADFWKTRLGDPLDVLINEGCDGDGKPG